CRPRCRRPGPGRKRTLVLGRRSRCGPPLAKRRLQGMSSASAVPGTWREMSDLGEEGRRRFRGDVGRGVAQFALSGILALVLLGFAGVYLLRHTGQAEAIRNAKQVTAVAGHGIVEPNISPGLERGDPAAIARLDRVVQRGVLDDRVVRVKIWRADGKILYSDVHKLIGSTYNSGADEQRVLRQGGIDA